MKYKMRTKKIATLMHRTARGAVAVAVDEFADVGAAGAEQHEAFQQAKQAAGPITLLGTGIGGRST
jgi:hypothetical protein